MAYLTVFFVAMSCLAMAKALSDPDISMILPKECEGMTFCDVEPADYPHIYFNEYVREMQKKNNFMSLRKNEVPKEDLMPKRFYDEENCSTETTVIYPFIAKSSTTTKLVVQSKYFKQKVTQTRCLQNRAPCFQSIKGLGYTSTCEEKYGEIQLYLYDPIDRTIKHESVRVPVCCRCITARNMK